MKTQLLFWFVTSLFVSTTFAHNMTKHPKSHSLLPKKAVSAIQKLNAQFVIPSSQAYNPGIQDLLKTPFMSQGDYDTDGKKDDFVVMVQDVKTHAGEILVLIQEGKGFRVVRNKALKLTNTEFPNYYIQHLPITDGGPRTEAFQVGINSPDGAASVMVYTYSAQTKKIVFY